MVWVSDEPELPAEVAVGVVSVGAGEGVVDCVGDVAVVPADELVESPELVDTDTG